ncbi:hypothetical protein COOONC_06116 [Cooperia oncophora]
MHLTVFHTFLGPYDFPSCKCLISACPAGQQLYGVECTRVAHYGQVCEKDSQCVDPFNACVAGTCQCAPGTTRDVMRGFCYAANTDSCPLGYRCVTYGSPYVGHCCRLRCPYGEPDLSQSCDAGAAPESKCRPLTHFCYTISEPGRCEGGISMSCALGTCQCKLGYHPYNDDRFPTCEKTCNQLEEIASTDRCLPKAQLGHRFLSRTVSGLSLTVDLERVNAYVDISRFE